MQKPVTAAPVSKKFTILYVYAIASLALAALGFVTSLVIKQFNFEEQLRQSFEKQGDAELLTPQFMHLMTICVYVGIAVSIAVFVGLMVYLIRLKSVKDVTIFLKVLLVWEVLGLLLVIVRTPSLTISFELIQIALTFMTLRSVSAGKNSFFWRKA